MPRDAGHLLARLAPSSPRRRCRAPGAGAGRPPAPRTRRSCRRASSRSPCTRRSCRRRRRARRSCSATSNAQFAKPSPPSGCSEAPAGMAYGFPPAASTSAIASSHEPPDADVEARPGRSRTSAPMMRRQQDVAHLVVDRVVPVHPVLLHEPALEPEVRRHGRHLAGVVGLVRRRSTPACRRPWPARPGRCTRACGSCCRRTPGRCCTSSRLAQIRAPPRCVGQPVERVHRARPERQPVARELGQSHRHILPGYSTARRRRAAVHSVSSTVKQPSRRLTVH